MPSAIIFKKGKYEILEHIPDFPNSGISIQEARKFGTTKEARIDDLPVSKEIFFNSFKKDFPTININHLK